MRDWPRQILHSVHLASRNELGLYIMEIVRVSIIMMVVYVQIHSLHSSVHSINTHFLSTYNALFWHPSICNYTCMYTMLFIGTLTLLYFKLVSNYISSFKNRRNPFCPRKFQWIWNFHITLDVEGN